MRKFFNWVYLTFHSIMLNISIALYNTENLILKADPNDLDEKSKKNQRMRHRNETLEKFYAGKADEVYTQKYYEILKGADKFMRTAKPHKVQVARDKYGMSYGKEDTHGEVHEHYGFFHPQKDNDKFGKSVGEIVELEKISRKTNDDDYEILRIFSNIPIEVGLAKIIENINADKKFDFKLEDLIKKSENFEFPMKIYRTDDKIPINKIEHITEYIHVKKIGMDVVRLEFFIPNKYKTNDLDLDSDIIKELIDIDQVFFTEKYGEVTGYKVNEYVKKIVFGEYTVFKFNCTVMEIK